MEEIIIQRANQLCQDGACMGSGYDEANPMTELNEAIVYLLMEDEVISDEVSGEELYDLLNKKQD